MKEYKVILVGAEEAEMSETDKISGLETYKVLGSMLALKEFTIKSLADYSGVNRDTVDTIRRRNPQFWDEIGKEETQKRGGQTKRFRVKPEQVGVLRRKLKGYFSQIKPPNELEGEEAAAVEEPQEAVQPPPEPPVSLAAGEEALLYLFTKARSLEDKQTLLEAAESDLRSGRHEVERLLKRGADERQAEDAKSWLQRVKALRNLSHAELAVEKRLSLQGELEPQSVLTQLFKSLQYLIKTGDAERAEALTKRMGKFVETISAPAVAKPAVAAASAAATPRVAAAAAAGGGTRGAYLSAVEPDFSSRHAIAVVPLTTGSSGEEYVGYGVTQGIARCLSLLPDLAVKIPSQYPLSYRQVKDVGTIRSVGRELDVDAVLVGVVNPKGNRIYCNTRLVDTSGGEVWELKHNRSFADIFEVGADISRTVSEALNIELPTEWAEIIGERPTGNAEAQRLYMEGRYNWSRWSADGLRKAITCYERALEKDLSFALAYAGLADCCNMMTYCTDASPREAFTKAKAAAYEALEYDETLAEAYTSLAYALARYYWRWDEAEAEFRRALTLSPSYTVARQWYAEFLAGMGRSPEALAQINLAQQLEPKSPIVSVTMGSIYYFNRQYDLAINQFRAVLENDPEFLRAHFRLGVVYTQVGRYEEALTHLHKALRLSQQNMRELALLGYTYAVSGNHAEARGILDTLLKQSEGRYVASYNLALIHTGLGEFDTALDRLRQAIDQRSPWLAFIRVDPRFDPLRDQQKFQERFREIVAAVGLAG